MKLSVRNLGRIAQAEIDVRPLTIFVGPNNTNKTWVAYCLYGLAQKLGFVDPASAWRSPLEAPRPLTDEIGHPVLQRRVEDAVGHIADASFARAAGAASDFTVSLPRADLVSSLLGDVRLRLGPLEIMSLLRLHREPQAHVEATLDVSPSDLASGPYDALRIDVEDHARFISLTPLRPSGLGPQKRFELRDDRDRLTLLRTVVCAFALWVHEHVAVLPAERKTLVASYKLLRPEFEEVMASPVVAFIELLRRPERQIQTDIQSESRRWAWSLLEERILGAPLHFFPRGAGPSFLFGGTADTELPIHAASSLVRALAGLDVYLKHFAAPGDLLIIDEPEMNAHPAAQLAITELIALLVNRGVRVLFTTHSPYVVDHVQNLVAASRVPDAHRDSIAGRLKLGRVEAFLAPDKVAVYHFGEDGVVEPVHDHAGSRIDWSTFSEVSDEVGNLYSYILAAEHGG